jgi:G:T-mismatch repair DNA endonuclease (very short patch repair protein)
MSRKTKQEVEEILKNKGYTLVGEEFTRTNKRYNILCAKHNKITNTALSRLLYGSNLGCCKVDNENPKLLDLEEIKKQLSDRRIEFCDGQKYIGNKKKYNFKCLTHDKIYNTTMSNIRIGYGLKCCRHERCSKIHKEWWDTNREEKLKWRSEKTIEYFSKEENREKTRQSTIDQLRSGKMPSSKTKPHLKIIDVLNKNNIKHETEKQIGRFVFDEFLPEQNTLIEVNGDYWHCNPKKFTNGPINEIQKRRMERDKFKCEYARSSGFNLVILWESDIKNKTDEYILNLICGALWHL